MLVRDASNLSLTRRRRRSSRHFAPEATCLVIKIIVGLIYFQVNWFTLNGYWTASSIVRCGVRDFEFGGQCKLRFTRLEQETGVNSTGFI